MPIKVKTLCIIKNDHLKSHATKDLVLYYTSSFMLPVPEILFTCMDVRHQDIDSLLIFIPSFS